MVYTWRYDSPIGSLLMAGDDEGLSGLWIDGQKHAGRVLAGCPHEEKGIPLFRDVSRWLDIYFSGREPGFAIPLHLIGSDFQKDVWEILLTIPYGKTMTYGDIAKAIAAKRGIPRMSAQAVGGAVGHNNILIIVPCHRVIGAGGNLTGFGGGIERKIMLLGLENAMSPSFYVPKKGTAL